MVQRICPYCRCEDSCGREAFVSRPSADEVGPSPTDVYNACFEFYGHDRIVPDVDSSYLARDLVRFSYLNLSVADVYEPRHRKLIREVER